jgi:hypothetical protein
MSLGEKGKGRLSSCYSVTERKSDENLAPKQTDNGRTKTIVGFIEQDLKTHLYKVHDDDGTLINSLHKAFERKSRVLFLHIYRIIQCNGKILVSGVCTNIFLENLIYFLCRKNIKPKTNFQNFV